MGRLSGASKLLYASVSHSNHMRGFSLYFLISAIFWIVVDWTTAFNPDFERWLSYMWSDRRVFLATLVGAFLVEVAFTGNKLLYTFPIMLIGIPIAISMYSLLTFVPKWIVENKIRQNKRKLIPMTIVWIFVSILTFVGNTN
jgi:hypothetical protein